MKKNKVLVIAPHPDDEVLGLGGTIARHSQEGDDVSLCIVTSAYEPDWTNKFIRRRQTEIENSCKVLKIYQIFKLNLPTVKLDTIPQKELNDKLAIIVGEEKPNVMYIPYRGDLNRDHRIVFESCLVASRPLTSGVKRILAYETLSETEWGQPLGYTFSPNVFVDITSTIKTKLGAMSCYKSELRNPPHPRSLEVINALAVKRGSEAGFKYAEAFELIRERI